MDTIIPANLMILFKLRNEKDLILDRFLFY